MAVSLRFCRRCLLTSAALLDVVALVIAVGVIPPVRTDTLPAATPERAAPAFWANVALNLLAAVAVTERDQEPLP